MSLGDERGNKTECWQCVGRFAQRTISPLHHRLGDFRHRHVDAGDGASLGHDHADDFGFHAWVGAACSGLPMLALTMVGGSTADKFDKRKILLITQYVQIGIAVSIGLLIWTKHIAIWQV